MADIGVDIDKAAKLLREGEIVAIPTETVYGLAANALNERAVVQIFEAKDRPFFDPLIVHIGRPEQAFRYISHAPSLAESLMRSFWPGPLTLVLPKKPVIPDLVTSGQSTVGLRMPDHPLSLQLLNTIDFPLAAPSANPFGYISPTRPGHVQAQLGGRIPYILDGGSCDVGLESTIIGFEEEQPVLYRLGGLPVEAIELITGPIRSRLNLSSDPKAPGQLKSHYAPSTPVRLMTAETITAYPTDDMRIGIISFEGQAILTGACKTWILSRTGNMNEAARNLFRILREADNVGLDLILAESLPEQGLGRAINDRLRRAAAHV